MTNTTLAQQEEADQRKNLETFLSEREFSLTQVTERMGKDHFDAFFKELRAMKKIIDIATIQARETKNVEHVGYILGAGARRQKDVVYGTLMDAIGGLSAINFNLVNKTYVAALRDYVMQQYDHGVRQCEQILER